MSSEKQAMHTPGPWTATHSDPAEGFDCWWITASIGPNMEKEVATVPGSSPTGSTEANARLIAAAPDMLEVLEECATLLRNSCPRIPPDGPRSEEERIEYETIGGAFSHAERVIAKARGTHV